MVALQSPWRYVGVMFPRNTVTLIDERVNCYIGTSVNHRGIHSGTNPKVCPKMIATMGSGGIVERLVFGLHASNLGVETKSRGMNEAII
jgi:hypothetical protein